MLGTHTIDGNDVQCVEQLLLKALDEEDIFVCVRRDYTRALLTESSSLITKKAMTRCRKSASRAALAAYLH